MRVSALLRVGLLLVLSGLLKKNSKCEQQGRNNKNAELCQQGKWANLARTGESSIPFTSQDECVSYGAKGGTIVPYQASTTRVSFTIGLLGEPLDNYCKVTTSLVDGLPGQEVSVVADISGGGQFTGSFIVGLTGETVVWYIPQGSAITTVVATDVKTGASIPVSPFSTARCGG